MEKPKESVLTKNDILFFYNQCLGKSSNEIKNRIAIDALSCKMKIPITVEFNVSGTYKGEDFMDKILIFDSDNKRKNKKFFQHLRNAFCHKYIEIVNGRCKLLDWNAFGDNKPKSYANKHITMIGEVDFASLQQLIYAFYSNQSKNKKV